MLKLRNETELSFTFSNNGYEDGLDIRFQRMLRVPDREALNARPMSLERFPLELVDDHETRIPTEMMTRGGVMMPLYPFEAMAISFSGGHPVPFAVKVGAGKINVLSGESWVEELKADQQDYIVVGGHANLDGFYVDRGLCRQFVAVPLEKGASVEEQVTGTADVGGIQIAVYPMRAELVAEKIAEHRSRMEAYRRNLFGASFSVSEMRMGFGMGGTLDQKLFTDPFGVSAWDQQSRLRCFVHLIATRSWRDLTGKSPPFSPMTAKDYRLAGLALDPTYAHYRVSRAGSKLLHGLKSVGDKMLSVISKDKKNKVIEEHAVRDMQSNFRNPDSLH